MSTSHLLLSTAINGRCPIIMRKDKSRIQRTTAEAFSIEFSTLTNYIEGKSSIAKTFFLQIFVASERPSQDSVLSRMRSILRATSSSSLSGAAAVGARLPPVPPSSASKVSLQHLSCSVVQRKIPKKSCFAHIKRHEKTGTFSYINHTFCASLVSSLSLATKF